MSKVSRLESEPWHVTTLRREEGDERRHKSYCSYYEDSRCKCIRSDYMNKRCGGSSHCSYYKVKPKMDEVIKAKKDNNEPYWY